MYTVPGVWNLLGQGGHDEDPCYATSAYGVRQLVLRTPYYYVGTQGAPGACQLAKWTSPILRICISTASRAHFVSAWSFSQPRF
jgi:hypothetical protein